MALTGTQFFTSIEKTDGAARETLILKALQANEVPSFQKPSVVVTVRDATGTHTITYSVMPDYLCIGTDADYFRVPMFPGTAQKAADHFDCSLPTKKMVDQIFAAAKIVLSRVELPSLAHPVPKGITVPKVFADQGYTAADMYRPSSQAYKDHNDAIQAELATTAWTAGDLVAGHKKDVVISKLLEATPNKVIIYGWHDKNNKNAPKQPLSNIHANTYVDYSHGIRLVKKEVRVDGNAMALADVLKDPQLSSLLNDEQKGPYTDKSVRVIP